MFSISYKKLLKYKIKRLLSKKPNIKNDLHFDFVSNLRKFGYCYIKNFTLSNPLSKQVIQNFEKISQNKINDLIIKNQQRGGRYEYRTLLTDLFNHKLLTEYANQSIFLNNIEQYFGFKPKVRYISVWLDYPTNKSKSMNSQLFHRDYDDVYLVKTFLCLTDISKENGPFQFIKESHIKPWKNEKNFKKNKLISLIAKKGDMYIADTNGMHKGKIVKKRYRAVLSVHYVSDKPFTGLPDKIII